MAIASTAQWYARPSATAGMLNGGGFVPGSSGTDYANQNAAQYNLTGVTSAGAGNTVLSASAADDMVGNIALAVSGTNVTTGRYEVTSVSAGVSITFSTNHLGTSIATGIVASGVINIGGAVDLSGGGLDTFLEQIIGGQTVNVLTGTYTPAANPSVSSTLSTGVAPSNIIGYTSTPGDTCTGSDRPLIAMGSNTWASGQFQNLKNLRYTGTATTIIVGGVGAAVDNCFGINTSTTGGRPGVRAGSDSYVTNCEGVSIAGQGIDSNSNTRIQGCSAHDSTHGFQFASSRGSLNQCLSWGNATTAVNLSSSNATQHIEGCTLSGTATPSGIGIRIAANAVNNIISNNIITGFTTGVTQTTAQAVSNMGRNNAFFNNTTNATNYTLAATDVTGVDPGFASVTQTSGATATISGSTLTQTGAFATNVTDGVSYLHVTGGTGATIAIYPIVSHTDDTVTVTGTIGTNATANKTWYIHNVNPDFAISGAI